MRLIVFLVRTRAGEGHLFIQTIAVQDIVDELSTIIRVEPQQGKGQALAHGLDGGKHKTLRAMENCHTLRPAGGNIGRGERIEKLSFDAVSTVGNQVDSTNPG